MYSLPAVLYGSDDTALVAIEELQSVVLVPADDVGQVVIVVAVGVSVGVSTLTGAAPQRTILAFVFGVLVSCR